MEWQLIGKVYLHRIDFFKFITLQNYGLWILFVIQQMNFLWMRIFILNRESFIYCLHILYSLSFYLYFFFLSLDFVCFLCFLCFLCSLCSLCFFGSICFICYLCFICSHCFQYFLLRKIGSHFILFSFSTSYTMIVLLIFSQA